MNLLFVGDVMLGRLVNDLLKQVPPEYPWGDTLPIFQKATLRICNLECVVSDIGQPWSVTPKIFHFRTETRNIKTLLAAGIDLVSLANNHTLDYEYEALFEMMETLSKNKICFSGAGRDIYEASSPIITEIQNFRIGLISFTDNEPFWKAKENKPGIFYVPIKTNDNRAKMLFEIIRRVRGEVDLLIISAHWGPNWGYFPPKEHPLFAHALIEAGADIIFGHSSHVFRGVEIYQNRPILYSTGNFIDDYAVDEIERNDQSFIFLVETNGQKILRLKLYPTLIENFQARLAKGEEVEEITQKMISLNEGFKTKSIWKKDYLEIPVCCN
jgi:poly-gamma-glutamate synthesis protein (capsule biosynthesis protein)